LEQAKKSQKEGENANACIVEGFQGNFGRVIPLSVATDLDGGLGA